MTTIINGSSPSITFSDSTTQTTAFTTGAVTQSTIATGVAGTGPAFLAYLSADQTITPAVGTKVALNTEWFDTASCFNNTGSTVGGIPAYSFLPNVAGYYQLTATINCEAATSPSRVLVNIQKAGGTSASVRCIDTTSPLNSENGSVLMYFNGTTDYAYVDCYMAASTAKISGNPSVPFSYFSGALVRAA